MAEYIEREAVNALIKAECSPKVAAYLIDAVATIHAADVRPVRKGVWEIVDQEEPRTYGCSVCKRLARFPHYYCPNCGADMREEQT